jgi:gliding motility-associated-like protein
MLHKFTFILLLNIFPFFLAAGNEDGNVRFEVNKGQWPSQVRYRADVPSGACFLEQKSITWNFTDPSAAGHNHNHSSDSDEHSRNLRGHAFRLNLIGASNHATLSPEGIYGDYSNYYIGNDSRKWASDVKAYSTVNWKQIYPGIHWKVYSNNQGMKYDFILEPNADPSNIQMQYDGLEKLQINQGKLLMITSVGTITEDAPIAFQEKNGVRIPVECQFNLNKNTITFKLGRYDKSLPLIIDPQLVFGSFSGSTIDNWGFTATYDQAGNTYSAGVVFGVGYPVGTGAWQQNFEGGTGSRPCDIGIIKFSPTGAKMYATYLGGNGNELPQSLIVSSSNELFVFGTTGSSDFATTHNAFSREFKGGPQISILRNGITFTEGTDMFITRFSENGNNLLASSLIGGTSNDGLNTANQLRYNYADEARGGIVIDQNNNIIIACSTTSTDFPVPGNGYQPEFGGGTQDGMIVKFNENLSSVFWGTYLGGSAPDGIFTLAIDRYANVYVAGGTTSTDFPTSSNAHQTSNAGGQSDGFISVIRANGQELLSSTYYGSDLYDQIYLLALDRQSRVYVYGQTEKGGTFYQDNFNFQENNGKQYISMFTNNLEDRTWSTTFGRGSAKPDITPTAFTVDICGQIFVAGWGGSSNSAPDGSTFGGTTGLTITDDAFQTSTDNNDFYLMVLDEQEQSLIYASFFGGATSSEHVDGGTSRFDRRGVMHQAVCAGCGGRDDFPTTPGVWSNINGSPSGCNNAVFKFDFQLPSTVASFTSPSIGCAPFTVDFNNTSVYGTTYRWQVNGSEVSTDENPSYTFTNAGVYTVRLIAENPTTCNVVDTFFKQVRVVNSTRDVFDSLEICLLGSQEIGPSFPIDPYYQVSWIPETGLQNPKEQSTIATPNESTNYTLLLSLDNCSDTIEQFVRVKIDSIDAGPDLDICRGQTVQIGLQPIADDYTYQWSPEQMLNSSTVAMPMASVDETTTFQLLRIPNDPAMGCPGKDSLTLLIPPGSPLADFETEIIASCTEVKVQIINTSELAQSFTWNFNQGTGDATSPNPQIIYPYGDTISISLIVSNPECSDTLNFKQPMGDLTSYFTINNANAFSPNGDGLNDCFSPALQDLPAPDDKNFLSCSSLSVFDRWGKKIWERIEQTDGCWEGKNEAGEEMPDGTYIFLFEGQGKKLEGTINLLR